MINMIARESSTELHTEPMNMMSVREDQYRERKGYFNF